MSMSHRTGSAQMTVDPDFYDHPDGGCPVIECTTRISGVKASSTARIRLDQPDGDGCVDFDDDAYRCVRLVDLTRLD